MEERVPVTFDFHYPRLDSTEQELRERQEGDRALIELALLGLHEQDPHALLDATVQIVAKSLRVEFAKVLELLPDRSALKLAAGVGWKPGAVGQAAVCTGLGSQAGYTIWEHELAEQRGAPAFEPVIVTDWSKEHRFRAPALLVEHGIASGVAVVIPGKKGPWGALGVDSRTPRRFERREAEFLQAAANLLSAALERCRAHTALQKSEDRFRSLANLSSDWFWEQDAELRFTFISEGFFERSGIRREDVLGKHRWDFSSAAPVDSSWEAHRTVLEAHLPFRDFEFWRVETDGTKQYQSVNGEPVYDDQGRFAGYRGTTRDITARKLSEQALREQRRLLARAQELAGLGYWEYDSSTGLVRGSRKLRYMLDIGDELSGQTPEWGLALVHREDRERVRALLQRSIQEGVNLEFETRIVTAKGTERILVISGEGVKDAAGDLSKVIGSCLDITEQRRRENALSDTAAELHALSTRLVEAQETERRRLAAELHDQVGQNLTALSINLDILAARMNGLDADATRRLQDSLALLEETTQRVEGVLDELRPPMLDDWGIGPTVQWVAEDFTRRIEIPASVRVLGTERRIDRPNELALVRIVQEALNNVTKHARAVQVEITLGWESDAVRIEVADDGIGFESDGSGGRQGLGLLSMRERIQAAHGLLEIESAPGKGTRVRASVPG